VEPNIRVGAQAEFSIPLQSCTRCTKPECRDFCDRFMGFTADPFNTSIDELVQQPPQAIYLTGSIPWVWQHMDRMSTLSC